MLPILVNERDIEPTVIEKVNHFVSFKFGDSQLLDIMSFFGGATRLFPQSLQDQRDKRFLSLRMVRLSRENEQQKLAPYDSLSSILRNSNPLEKVTTTFKTWSTVV